MTFQASSDLEERVFFESLARRGLGQGNMECQVL